MPYDNDLVAQGLLNKLKADPNGTLHYTLRDGLIRYKGRLWIGNEAELCKRLLHAMHSSVLAATAEFRSLTAVLNNILPSQV